MQEQDLYCIRKEFLKDVKGMVIFIFSFESSPSNMRIIVVLALFIVAVDICHLTAKLE